MGDVNVVNSYAVHIINNDCDAIYFNDEICR